MAELNFEQLHGVSGGMSSGLRFTTHRVQSGQTLAQIAQQTGVPVETLMEDNFIFDKDIKLKPNAMLYVRAKA